MTAEPVPIAIDLGSVTARLRRHWLGLLVGLAAGLALAAAVLLWYPPRFAGSAMILIRTSNADPTALVRNRLGPLSELMPSALGGGGDEELETELALLSSRAVAGAVVDSLMLQIVPRSPSRIPPRAIVDSARFVELFKPRKVTLHAGLNQLPEGKIWARAAADVKINDRDDAIDDLTNRTAERKTNGDAVEISYRARDSVTAEQVPNLIAAVYMARRKTVDRGLNQRRLEFLMAKADSVRRDLRGSADALASVAEQNQMGTSPDIAGKALADEAGTLEARLSELRGTGRALDSLIAAAQSKRMDPRWLAGFPDLLKSPALNALITQIADVETQRTVLLSRAAETAPSVIALAHARDSLSAQVLPLAEAYRESLRRQVTSLEGDRARLQTEIDRLPAQTAAVVKEQAEVTRLAQLNAGMGAQVLDARLAALAEGGDVRVIDPAVTPRRPSFPRPAPTLVAGAVIGLLVGLAWALFAGGEERAVSALKHVKSLGGGTEDPSLALLARDDKAAVLARDDRERTLTS